MNLEEFREKYRHVCQKQKIAICCDICGTEHHIYRGKAEENIIQNGCYIDRSCSMKRSHAESPRGESTKEKQRMGRLGKKQSPETKKKMAEAKRAYFQSPEGKALKRKLSWLAAKGHANHKFENSSRNGWYFSTINQDLVFYGSSYELRLCWELDQQPETVESYETQIEHHMEKRSRCIDCIVTFKDGSKKVIEVKPRSRLTEHANISQIEDAKAFALNHGYQFEVVTEDTFNMTEKEIRNWADEFRSEMEFFDWVAFRQEKSRTKAKNYYYRNIAENKVTVECKFCNCTHDVLELNYKKNMARNGRYICEREGGHISGSKPKISQRKDNPYVDQGKKECLACKEVKAFEEFGADKSRRDGYATNCKLCRAKKAAENYRNA